MRNLAALVVLAFLTSCASIPTIEQIPQRDYVAIGDSVSAGVGAGGTVDLSDPAASVDRRRAFPYLLAKAMGVRHANLAAPGAMADDVRRLQVAPALAYRPNVVTLWVGGNDLVHGRDPREYGASLALILARLDEMGLAKVYVLNLPDVWAAKRFRDKPDNDVTPARVAAFNSATAVAVSNYGGILVDISGPALVADGMLADDDFHPGPKAHVWLADRILATMEKSR